ncbi:MAG: hypothetical protein MJY43_00305 [Bacteroidales bacterium]|nr:hypothetical protein [Bacteroidales bacterium]
MDRFALIGSDIGHSESPELFRKAYGGRWKYDLIDEKDFDKALSIFTEGPYKAANVTSPFKTDAAAAADWKSAEVTACGAANILMKEDGILKAFNSDFLAISRLLSVYEGNVSVIGFGGAGKAAAAAAADAGRRVRIFHHDEIEDPVEDEIIIYTLPCAVPGYRNLQARVLIESNYKDPVCTDLDGVQWYVPGKDWLLAQAVTGYPLMTGEQTEF